MMDSEKAQRIEKAFAAAWLSMMAGIFLFLCWWSPGVRLVAMAFAGVAGLLLVVMVTGCCIQILTGWGSR